MLLLGIVTFVTISLLVLSVLDPLNRFWFYWVDFVAFCLIAEAVAWCFIVVMWLRRRRPSAPTKKARSRQERRRDADRLLRWYRGSLFTYLMLSGWIYLALSLANIAPRREASAGVDRFVQLGETASRQ